MAFQYYYPQQGQMQGIQYQQPQQQEQQQQQIDPQQLLDMYKQYKDIKGMNAGGSPTASSTQASTYGLQGIFGGSAPASQGLSSTYGMQGIFGGQAPATQSLSSMYGTNLGGTQAIQALPSTAGPTIGSAPASSVGSAPASSLGSSGGGMGAGGAWWAALAAVIAGNESNARDRGYRDKSKSGQVTDALAGDTLYQDMTKRWMPKVGIKEGTFANKAIGLSNAPMNLRVDRTFKRIKDLF